jgi:alanine racemase
MRYSTELRINLKNLSYNYDLLKKVAPGNKTIFMVKANAYGHGIFEIVNYSYTELGITRFGCASLGEAISIRKKYPQMKCELWVFSETNLELDECREYYLDYNIVPVIHDLDDFKLIVSDSEFLNMPLVLKLDTGMHRIGINASDITSILETLKRNSRKKIHHLMTHFGNSYLKIKNGDRTYRQYESFTSTKTKLLDAGIKIEETSCSNSGAIEQGFGLEESHIRPGLMLYGPSASNNGKIWSGRSLSTFKTKVLKILPIKRGTPVGYGGHVCGKDGFVVYIPVGYGDGILTFYTGVKLRILDEDAHVIGRVNMDLTAIFFEKLPAGLEKGSEFLLWSDDAHYISKLANQMKTSPYQLFTAVTSRVPRRYIE